MLRRVLSWTHIKTLIYVVDRVEYVVVHEMLHLLKPTHIERFVAVLTRYWPQWQEARKALNALPLGTASWAE